MFHPPIPQSLIKKVKKTKRSLLTDSFVQYSMVSRLSLMLRLTSRPVACPTKTEPTERERTDRIRWTLLVSQTFTLYMMGLYYLGDILPILGGFGGKISSAKT